MFSLTWLTKNSFLRNTEKEREMGREEERGKLCLEKTGPLTDNIGRLRACNARFAEKLDFLYRTVRNAYILVTSGNNPSVLGQIILPGISGFP